MIALPDSTILAAVPEPPTQLGTRVTPKRRFTLLSDADVEDMRDPAWLVDNILPSRALALLYGPPGSFKTFLALDMGFAIATAGDWCGHATTPGAVIYVVAEGVAGLSARVKAWKCARDVQSASRMYFLPEAVQLTNVGDVETFVADVSAQVTEPIALVIIDTLARCFVGCDENSAQHAGMLIDGAARVGEQLDAAVLLIHHTTKTGSAERGSSAFRGATDTMIETKRSGESVTIHCEKQKDAPEFEDFKVRLVGSADSCVVQTLAASGPGVRAIECLEALARLTATGDVRCSEWQDASGMSVSTFFRYRKQLEDGEYIGVQNDLYSVTNKGRELLGSTS